MLYTGQSSEDNFTCHLLLYICYRLRPIFTLPSLPTRNHNAVSGDIIVSEHFPLHCSFNNNRKGFLNIAIVSKEIRNSLHAHLFCTYSLDYTSREVLNKSV